MTSTQVWPIALRDGEQQVLQVGARLRVDRGQRLVEQQQPRLRGEPAGDGDALLHAAGQLPGIAVFEAGEAHGIEQAGRLLDLVRLA